MRAEALLPQVPPPPRPVATVLRTPRPLPKLIAKSVAVHQPRGPARDEGLVQQSINGAKTLLFEVLRRAAFDWVLYKSSTRLPHKILAQQAFQWLFVERPGTEEWDERMREGKYITGFIGVCEALSLDPETVRSRIRELTPKSVMSVGRPKEFRRAEPATRRLPALEGADDDG